MWMCYGNMDLKLIVSISSVSIHVHYKFVNSHCQKPMLVVATFSNVNGSEPSLVPRIDTNLILCILYSLLQVLT